MKYTLDFEFYERPGAEPGSLTITPISVGMVAEDGRELYAVNAQFGWANVPKDHWLQQNVRPFVGDGPHLIVPQIRDAILQFTAFDRPEFWGYFADYDWVALAGLFGRMVDLPPHYPKWCRDIKQELDRRGLDKDVVPVRRLAQVHNALDDARWMMDAIQTIEGYDIRAAA